jgi:bacteriocin biosynthesis cyclodehydratase domain-containing protein
MVLKLDPLVPTVWRDPFSLQFGVDPARVVLRDVSLADEQVISALMSGVTRAGLSMVGRAAGVAEADVARLIRDLSPLLLEAPAPRPAPTVAIVGVGRTVEELAATLIESGLTAVVTSAVSDAACDFGVAVGHYVLDPQVYGFWLRRDLPHLSIVFGDGIATVGPLVEPGTTPCLYCLEHHRRDADKSWSAIASQLWGRRSAAETPLVSREVAAIAARAVVRRLAPGLGGGAAGPAAAASIRIAVDSGETTRRDWMPHPECGCVVLPTAHPRDTPAASAATADLSGSDSAGDWGLPRRNADAPGPA